MTVWRERYFERISSRCQVVVSVKPGDEGARTWRIGDGVWNDRGRYHWRR